MFSAATILVVLGFFLLLSCLFGLAYLGFWVARQIQERDAAREAAPHPRSWEGEDRPQPPSRATAPPAVKEDGYTLLRRRDPKFSTKAFLARANAAFLKMRECAEKRDYAPARSFLSDGQAESCSLRLELEELQGRRFVANDFQLTSCELHGVESDRIFDAVYVAFAGLRRLDEIATSTGARVAAAPREMFHEIWTFVRRPGRGTLDKPGLIEGFCPNCGAPVSLSDAGRCSACSSWLNSGEYDWVLTKTTDAKYWTPLSQLTRDPGLELLGQADPGSNLHFQEDRVLMDFWRWKLAVASRSTAPLTAVALPEFLAGVEGELKSAPPDAGGIVVEDLKFASFKFGDPLDTVTYRVRWSGWEGLPFPPGDPQRRWVTKLAHLSLVRKKGTQTAARSGLCSSRCHNCGAPPTRRDLAACEYCGTPFNDGGHHWTLSEIA